MGDQEQQEKSGTPRDQSLPGFSEMFGYLLSTSKIHRQVATYTDPSTVQQTHEPYYFPYSHLTAEHDPAKEIVQYRTSYKQGTGTLSDTADSVDHRSTTKSCSPSISHLEESSPLPPGGKKLKGNVVDYWGQSKTQSKHACRRGRNLVGDASEISAEARRDRTSNSRTTPSKARPHNSNQEKHDIGSQEQQTSQHTEKEKERRRYESMNLVQIERMLKSLLMFAEDDPRQGRHNSSRAGPANEALENDKTRADCPLEMDKGLVLARAVVAIAELCYLDRMFPGLRDLVPQEIRNPPGSGLDPLVPRLLPDNYSVPAQADESQVILVKREVLDPIVPEWNKLERSECKSKRSKTDDKSHPLAQPPTPASSSSESMDYKYDMCE